MKNLPPQGPAGAQDHPAKVTIRSWYLARALGVTTKPPDIGTDYIEVRVEGGPPLFWTVIGRPEAATPQE